MQTVTLKLVTIVGEEILGDLVIADIQQLGVRGYTRTAVIGEGSRHLRASEVPGENVKIETVVSPELAEKIVEHIAHKFFSHFAVLVYVTDVTVVRGEKYV